MKFSSLITVSLLLSLNLGEVKGETAPVQQDTNQVLSGLLNESFAKQPEVLNLLLESKVVTPAVGTAAVIKDNTYYVAVARRVNSRMPIKAKDHVLRKELTSALFRLAVSDSKELKKALEKYKYKEVLIEYAHKRLYTKFEAQVSELGLHMKHHHGVLYSTGIITLPVEKLTVSEVQLVSDKETLVYYRNALNKSVKSSINIKDYSTAAVTLLEMKKYGAFTTGMMVDLYHCFAMGGTVDETEKAYLLLKNKGNLFSYDELVQLAEIAQKAKKKKQEIFWDLQAEARIKKGLTLDMLMSE